MSIFLRKNLLSGALSSTEACRALGNWSFCRFVASLAGLHNLHVSGILFSAIIPQVLKYSLYNIILRGVSKAGFLRYSGPFCRLPYSEGGEEF